MIKQRFLGLALSLAFVATLGFAATATAADNDSFTVEATVADTLILEIDQTSINFGNGINFFGANPGPGVTVCTGFNDGARYVSPNITATVSSNKTYSITRSVSAGTANPNTTAHLLDLASRSRIASGTFANCASSAGTGTPILSVLPVFVSGQTATMSRSHSEFYTFDVNVNSIGGTYSLTAVYTASAS